MKSLLAILAIIFVATSSYALDSSDGPVIGPRKNIAQAVVDQNKADYGIKVVPTPKVPDPVTARGYHAVEPYTGPNMGLGGDSVPRNYGYDYGSGGYVSYVGMAGVGAADFSGYNIGAGVITGPSRNIASGSLRGGGFNVASGSLRGGGFNVGSGSTPSGGGHSCGGGSSSSSASSGSASGARGGGGRR